MWEDVEEAKVQEEEVGVLLSELAMLHAFMVVHLAVTCCPLLALVPLAAWLPPSAQQLF